ncbi:hypothetical protein BLGI_1710 [Brevibacillus laterosporus GI-9]|nr:hypothetical protein BLGI_1710 [Brevibacillus laterosporus GI-9]
MTKKENDTIVMLKRQKVTLTGDFPLINDGMILLCLRMNQFDLDDL